METVMLKDKTKWEDEIVTKGEWLIVILLTCIPIINIIMHSIIVFRKKEKRSLSNFSFILFWFLLATYLITVFELLYK